MPQSWESYIRGEEHAHDAAAQQAKMCRCLSAILREHSADHLGDLARYAYKYTDCGASIGALLWRGEDNPGLWVYGSDLRNVNMSEEIVTALSVSSIVEGVDQETETHIVDLLTIRGPKTAAKAYNAALDAVEHEAKEIWKQTHGCPTCAKHWNNCGEFGQIEGDDGMTPIWDECPDCGGDGTVI